VSAQREKSLRTNFNELNLNLLMGWREQQLLLATGEISG
jgi:hypothetical protein